MDQTLWVAVNGSSRMVSRFGTGQAVVCGSRAQSAKHWVAENRYVQVGVGIHQQLFKEVESFKITRDDILNTESGYLWPAGATNRDQRLVRLFLRWLRRRQQSQRQLRSPFGAVVEWCRARQCVGRRSRFVKCGSIELQHRPASTGEQGGCNSICAGKN